MSLSTRIALLVSVIVVAGVGMVHVTRQWFILPSFLAAERDEAREHVTRCLHAIDRELHHLDALCYDWAAWDDTFEYVVEPSAEYEKANLALPTFTDNEINLLFILDAQGRVVWGKVYDLETKEPAPMAQFPEKHWATTHPLLKHESKGSAIVGVIVTDRGAMMIASRPILTTQSEGPIRGTLVMGRLITDNVVGNIEKQTLSTINLSPVRDDWLTEAEAQVLAQISPDSPYCFQEASDDMLHAYAVFPGLTGDPTLLARLDIERDIVANGREAMRFSRRAILLTSLAALAVVLVLLHQTVIRPVSKLTAHVTQIGGSDDLTLAAPAARRDEIGALGREFNRMVRRLQHENAERKQAEAALRDGEARLRAIFDQAPDGIITCDAHGVIESANPEAARLFGYSQGALTGQSICGLIPDLLCVDEAGGDARAAVCTPERIAQAGPEGTGRRRDGAEFPIYSSAAAIQLEDRRLYTIVIRDLTELKEMHERVLRAEHLATIGEMAAAIAHDIRNPLTGISGAVQVLADSLDAHDERKEVGKEMVDLVNRVDAIVRRLLVFARSHTPDKAPCDLRAVAGQICREAQAQDMGNRVQYTFEGPAAFMASADRALVEQVFRNVLENAIQATNNGAGAAPTGAAPALEVHWKFLETDAGGQVSITDTGCGMSPEVQAKALRPFFTTKMDGIGLGLAICRRIMEAHGGGIRIVSTPAKGTTVELDFPRGNTP